MSANKLKPFAKDFLWGASTSAYQVEGAYLEDGKQLSVQDDPNSSFKELIDTTKSCADFNVAVDHYHQFETDIALMAEMGLKAYRFSIAWPRIYPDGEHVNQKGIDHYHEVFQCLKKHHIEPIVTIYHFDLPLALDKKGGWSNRELMLDAWNKYIKTLFTEFKNDVKYWLTINEQNMMGMVDIMAAHKQNKDLAAVFQTIVNNNHHMFLANALAVKMCHEMCPNAKIGPAPNICRVYPRTCDPKDVLAAHNMASLLHYWYLDAYTFGTYPQIVINFFDKYGVKFPIQANDFEILKQGKADFLAFNYYFTFTAADLDYKTNKEGPFAFKFPYIGQVLDNDQIKEKTKSGWSVDPIGFRLTFYDLYERYHLPLMVTENGLGTTDEFTSDHKIHDQYRIKYLKDHIEQMHIAYSDGIPIIAYCPWSAIDLISTHEGISKRYGFIYVDRDETDLKDLKRYKKDSFHWYQKVIQSNGESLE